MGHGGNPNAYRKETPYFQLVDWMTQIQTDKELLSRVAFLVGDWRGTGVLEYPGPPARRSNYDILAMCKWSPDKTQLLLTAFNDDPRNHTMFHASQAFIYVDRASNQLRIRRNWLMDTDSDGFVTVERITQKGDTESFGFTVIDREGVSETFQHEGTIERANDSEIVITGVAKAEGRAYPYVDKYRRQPRPSP